jgi:hypothetical protein
VILFRYKNSQRDLVDVVSILVTGLFASKAILELTGWGFYFWVVTAIGLGTAYLLRFIKKKEIGRFDWLKLAGVILLTLYPLSAFDFEGQYRIHEYYLGNLIIPVVGTIYVYDRLVLNTEMKRKYIIILSIQSIVILLMLAFSIAQKAEADRQVIRAESERERADRLQYELTKLRTDKKNDR